MITYPECAPGIGQVPGRVIEVVTSPAIEDTLAVETECAKSLGIFGAPSFVVDGEVFWEDDRLDDVIVVAKGPRGLKRQALCTSRSDCCRRSSRP